ncbi:MAG: DUF6167 family protein [Nocardioidaceae bacterium]
MSRVLWFAAGAASGVYGLLKAKRTAWNFTPDGVGARVAAVTASARLFADEVSNGMAEREAELREQLRLPAAAGEQGEQRAIERRRTKEHASSVATPEPTPTPTPTAGKHEGPPDGNR